MAARTSKYSLTQRIVFSIILVVILGATGFFYFGPTIIEKQMNTRLKSTLPHMSSEANRLHETLAITDLHADSLLWNRDLRKQHQWAHVDIPRLIQGNVALQTFSIVSKSPKGLNLQSNSADSDSITLLTVAQLWPPRTWGSLLQRALYQSQKLYEFQERSDGRLYIITNKRELTDYLKRRKITKNITAGWLSIEGAQVLEADLNNLDTLYDAGFRMIAPTHFFDTAIAGSKHGVDKYGLTALGRDWVIEMNKKHMIIDLAHASDKTIDDILALTTKPVIVSHTGVKGTCDNNRNLSDQQLNQIANNGGLIGIGFWPSATCGNDLKSVTAAIRYTVNKVGIDHVAYGSDFDGAVATPIDISEIALLTQALLDEGFSESDIRKIAGQNTLNFLLNNLPD